MKRKLYEKVGARYKEIGEEFMGFPTDGLWLVQDGRRNCITQISEIPEIPKMATMFRASMQEDIAHYIMVRLVGRSTSTYELAKIASDAVAYVLQNKKEKLNDTF